MNCNHEFVNRVLNGIYTGKLVCKHCGFIKDIVKKVKFEQLYEMNGEPVQEDNPEWVKKLKVGSPGPKTRPETTQTVIDEFTKLLDSRNKKGIEEYGESMDEAKDADYDWRLMALEETADLQQYLVKEIRRLEKALADKNRDIDILIATGKKLEKGWDEWEKEAKLTHELVDSLTEENTKLKHEIEFLKAGKAFYKAEADKLANRQPKQPSHDCNKNQRIHWGMDGRITAIYCEVCKKELYKEEAQ